MSRFFFCFLFSNLKILDQIWKLAKKLNWYLFSRTALYFSKPQHKVVCTSVWRPYKSTGCWNFACVASTHRESGHGRYEAGFAAIEAEVLLRAKRAFRRRLRVANNMKIPSLVDCSARSGIRPISFCYFFFFFASISSKTR